MITMTGNPIVIKSNNLRSKEVGFKISVHVWHKDLANEKYTHTSTKKASI
jgi:hypothetical protein